MDLGLEGRKAWVIGGSRGLGFAVARSLASEGAVVALSARSARGLVDAREQVARVSAHKVVVEPLDVSELEAIDPAITTVVGRLGGLDIVVCCPGGPVPGGIADVEYSEFEGAFRAIVGSAFRILTGVVEHMRSGGVVVFVVSSSTKQVIDGLLLSNVMRQAVAGLAKSAARELGRQGIRVMCVAPGRFETDRVRDLDVRRARASGSTPEAVRAASVGAIPMGRYGHPEEFGDAVAFLCSDKSSYTTGITLVIDGGMIASTSA